MNGKTITGMGIILFLIVCSIIFYWSNLVSVEAGFEMVETRQPYFLGDDGVNPTPFPTGRHFIWPSSSVKHYDIRPQKHVEKFVDITASDNVPIDFSATFVFIQKPGASPVVHENFGEAWYRTKVQDKLRTLTRNEARDRSSADLRTNRTTIEDFQTNTLEKGNTFLTDANIPFIIQQVQVGRVVPPQELIEEAARTAAQKQRKRTQDARQLAEAAREAAERSAATADKAYMTEIGMTPDQYLKSRALDLRQEQLAILKEAKGKANFNVYMIDGGSSPAPVIPMQ